MHSHANSEGHRSQKEADEEKGLVMGDEKTETQEDQNASGDLAKADHPIDYEHKHERLLYSLVQVPPVFVMIPVAMQHLLSCLGSALVISFVLSDLLCCSPSDPLRAVLFSTTLCMSGVCTLLQTVFGVRLPVYQGPSSSFLVPLLILSTEPQWVCPAPEAASMAGNITNVTTNHTGLTQIQKLNRIAGSLMAAALMEVLLGLLGVVSVLMSIIGPITIGPTIALIGLSLIKIPILLSPPSWPLAVTSCMLTLLFSLVLNRIRVPVPSLTCGRTKRRARRSFPIFQLIPILLSISVTWMIAAIMTSLNVFSSDSGAPDFPARTDAKADVITNTPWFIFPYPGQFGVPEFNSVIFVGFLAAFVTSIIESVGDYYATSRACQVPPPPREAVTRGILIEGLGSVLGAASGACHATTSYSGNVAIISLSQTASRSVMVCVGVIQVAISLLGKFGAALATVPAPVLGGIQFAMLGMLIAIGISTLSQVNMGSSRNQVIVGFAFLVGMALPLYMEGHPDVIKTGNREADQVLKMVLQTPMLIGGVAACLLDNLVPGTPRERGIATSDREKGKAQSSREGGLSVEEVYGLPLVARLQSAFPCLRYLPFLPAYRSATTTDTSDDRGNVELLSMTAIPSHQTNS